MDAKQKLMVKGIVAVLFATIGATIAISPLGVMKFKQFPAELIPHLDKPAYTLLGVVLVMAMQLGYAGKTSASWAVIAYGSLSVGLLKSAAGAAWYAQDQMRENGGGIALSTLLVGVIIVGGLIAAYQSRWKWMLVWSLLVFVGLFFYVPTLLYAQYFYCLRHNLLH